MIAPGERRLPRGGVAVAARRHEPPDSLDYFPTPPWATRALFEHVLPTQGIAIHGPVFDPACGEGHMAAVFSEYSDRVIASDIFDYGYGEVADFLDGAMHPASDWIITNPPFNAAVDFALTALTHPGAMPRRGVALLCRTQWIEGADRFERLFRDHPPRAVAFFVERVPMHKGRWDPRGKTATAYAWFVWTLPELEHPSPTRVIWIPPGQRKALTRPADYARFAARAAAPLLEEV